MPTLRNTNPLGAVDLPLIGRTLEAGEEFEVSDEQAAALLRQVGNYEPVSAAGDVFDGMKVPELKQYAEQHDIDLGDATKKADIIAAIKKG